jgi:hypothetical protein
MAAVAILVRSALALALLAVAACRDDVDADRALAADHVTTTGKVSEVWCGDRDAVYYVFPAGGRFHWAKAPRGAVDCEHARVGDPVLVWYAPLDPATSTVLRPDEAYERTHPGWLSAGGWIAFAGAAIVALSLRLASRRARHPARP